MGTVCSLQSEVSFEGVERLGAVAGCQLLNRSKI